MIKSVACFTFACGLLAAQSDELRYAVIVTRHGVRAPTWTPERLNRYSSDAWPDFGVPAGHLTAHGRELMRLMGGFYRGYFASQSLISSAGCSDAARTHIHADSDERTVETARALAQGMLPGCASEIHALEEGTSDPLFDPLAAGVARQEPGFGMAAVAGRIGPRLDALIDANRAAFNALEGVLHGGGTAQRSLFEESVSLHEGNDAVTMAGPLNLASTLSENLLLEYTNGMSGNGLGWGRLDEAKLTQILSLHTAYADLMRRTPYVARVRGSNLLSHILRSLEQAASGKPVAGSIGSPRDALLILSGHDTNISNLSGMLDLSWVLPGYQPDDSPPGGALIFTLWRAKDTARYSVKLQFLAATLRQMHDAAPLSAAEPPAIADLFIPGCSGAAKGYSCTLAGFRVAASAAIVQGAVAK